MKTFATIFLGVGLILAAASAPVYAADVDQVISEHLAKAASYEEKAKAQDALIAEHQQEKKDYKKRYYINDKITPPQTLAVVEKHCDAVIGDAAKVRDDLQEFAKWHRMRATELKGR
ncbi:MAG: hypothetical protein EPO39_09560 [Candidatus Manganitrophaceae bacterium]|nr:MAG: hypothetical protein EPO39_09560 [Candidatus Manganitrophaceae bacterium]